MMLMSQHEGLNFNNCAQKKNTCTHFENDKNVMCLYGPLSVNSTTYVRLVSLRHTSFWQGNRH